MACRRDQSLGLFCSLFTQTIFLMSLAWLNLCCLLMIQIYFVPIGIPTTLLPLLTTNLQKTLLGLKLIRSLNLTKTNFMIFHPREKKINVVVPLVMENTIMKQVVEIKFLGVIIDQHLSWKSHIGFVSKKISKTVGIIAKARFYLSSKSLLTLYYSLVYSYLTYCNVAWSSTYCSSLNCIYLLQKRIVRLLS